MLNFDYNGLMSDYSCTIRLLILYKEQFVSSATIHIYPYVYTYIWGNGGLDRFVPAHKHNKNGLF